MESRTPQRTQEKLNELRRTTDIAHCATTLVELIEQHYTTEVRVATRYSQDTGKPVEYEWRPEMRFSTSICMGQLLAPELVTKLKERLGYERALLIPTENGQYVFTIHQQAAVAYSDYWRTEIGNADYLQIRKAELL